MSHALVTGGCGFIGSHVVDRLVRDDWQVTVVDQMPARDPRVRHIQGDIVAAETWDGIGPVDVIVHLAAKAGVRASLQNPMSVQRTNVLGTQQVLEFAKTQNLGPERRAYQPVVVFASSSSVYGLNPDRPWREDAELAPASPYAASKVAGEALGHVYSHCYGIPFYALRFFTVFGPRQRRDLAIHRFADRLVRHEPIQLYGDGNTSRDYTYVGDVVDAIMRAIDYRSLPALFNIWNIGAGQPCRLDALVYHVFKAFGTSVGVEWKADQLGDVPHTWADASKARRDLGWEATTSLDDGLQAFAQWYLQQQAA